jgi:hypothetical protein
MIYTGHQGFKFVASGKGRDILVVSRGDFVYGMLNGFQRPIDIEKQVQGGKYT